MPYPEFARLLSGISPKTPLGNIVSIRMENDKDALKQFTPDQHRIRSAWRSKQASATPVKEKENGAEQLQQMFAQMFSSKKGR